MVPFRPSGKGGLEAKYSVRKSGREDYGKWTVGRVGVEQWG